METTYKGIITALLRQWSCAVVSIEDINLSGIVMAQQIPGDDGEPRQNLEGIKIPEEIIVTIPGEQPLKTPGDFFCLNCVRFRGIKGCHKRRFAGKNELTVITS